MSFRKRNLAISSNAKSTQIQSEQALVKRQLSGVRPSPLDGRPVTSTGTSVLDGLLAGHGGLALGCSLLIQESGTTDYAGALLKFYAAEGLLQGHHVHVVGLPEQWGRELPGIVSEDTKAKAGAESEKMKIAWRYESLGQFGSLTSTRETPGQLSTPPTASSKPVNQPPPFNHSFDLTKRLVHPVSATLSFMPSSPSPNTSPFSSVISKLSSVLTSSPPNTVHRLLIPSLLSPLLYPNHACNPHHLLSFLHFLRSLLSTFNLTAMVTLPLSLYPRAAGLTRWIELLSDGVLELAPFPHTSVALPPPPTPAASTFEEPPQGLLRIHKLPILNDIGSGTQSYDDDWTFSLSRKKLTIKPFNLPPLEGDAQAQQETMQVAADGDQKGQIKKANKGDLEF